MKRRILAAAIIAGMFFFTGCDEHDRYIDTVSYDYTPPAIPTGVQTSNGDENVYISWLSNSEKDLAGYNVYYSTSYDGRYTLLGSTDRTYFYDNNLTNGNKYYYAVTAYDYDNNESELSREDVYGIGRPQKADRSISWQRAA